MKCDLCEESLILDEENVISFNEGNFHERCFQEIQGWMITSKRYKTYSKERKESFLREINILKGLYSNQKIQEILNIIIAKNIAE